MEDLSREVGHVAVEEDKQWLDDSWVQGESGGEGAQEAVDGAHQDASEGNHKETDDTQDGIDHGHSPSVGKLLKEMIEDLQRVRAAHVSQLGLSSRIYMQNL